MHDSLFALSLSVNIELILVKLGGLQISVRVMYSVHGVWGNEVKQGAV